MTNPSPTIYKTETAGASPPTSETLRVSPESARISGAAKTSKTMRGVSAAVVAVISFCCLNGVAGLAFADRMREPFELQNHDAAWWAVKNFKELKGKTDVVLLGSSLMCRVVNEGDATFLNRPVNALGHYRSLHLESGIIASLPPLQKHHYRSASLAVGGMNVSDVALLVPPLLVGERKPSVIVYGIGPRDMFDNSLESPADSPAFRLAEKITPLGNDIEQICKPSREARFKLAFNDILHSAFSLYRYQDELATSLRRTIKAAVDSFIPKPATSLTLAFDTTQKTLMHLLPADVENVCEVKPDDPQHHEHFDFTNNYFMSYNPFRPALYKRQLFFLDRFLKQCDKDGIKVVLVKMPLRSDNFKLMAPNFYNLYSQDVARLAQVNHATLVDGAAVARFADDDFTDTVHLTGTGSCKLVDAISPIVSRAIVDQNNRSASN